MEQLYRYLLKCKLTLTENISKLKVMQVNQRLRLIFIKNHEKLGKWQLLTQALHQLHFKGETMTRSLQK